MPRFHITSPLASIDWGSTLSRAQVSIYFAPPGVTLDGYTSEGFTAYERAQYMDVLGRIAAVTNLTFTETTNPNATLRIVQDTNEVYGDFAGYFYPPGEFGAGIGVFDATQGVRSPGGTLEPGGWDHNLILHELLHGLGLAHPHDRGGTSSIMTGVSSAYDSYGIWSLNQGVYTVMSYNDGFQTGPAGSAPPDSFYIYYGMAAGPMALDIAVLQAMYGANTTTARGNDVYILPEANVPGTYWTSIWDSAGVDEIRYNGAGNVTIDLTAATLAYTPDGGGVVSHVTGGPGGAVAGGFTIAAGVVIENATGGRGNDRLEGNDANNLLIGNAGNDSLRGNGGRDWITPGTGNDTIDGGSGMDMISFADHSVAVIVDLTAGTARSGADTNRIRLIENVTGSSHSDFLTGNSDDNLLRGLGGYDWFISSRGNDTYDGSGGRDMVTYINARASVTVDLGAQRGLAGEAATHTYIALERVTGTVYDDIFYGSAGSDEFRGAGGYDLFYDSAGRDRYDGGTGLDTVSYALSASAVNASLTQGSGGPNRDLYTSIENLIGSNRNDALTGDAGRNVLRGGHGNDTLLGMAGNDYLEGGTGNDVLDGGLGYDVALYRNAASEYTVRTVGDVTTLRHATDGIDTLTGIEALRFADGFIFI